MMFMIDNVNLIMPDHYIMGARLLIRDGVIEDFGEKIKIPAGTEVFDAEGYFCGPGLIDIHMHSGDKYYFNKSPAEAAAYHLAHGVTSLMPALYFNMNQKEYLEGIEAIKKCAGTNKGRNIKGIYMEGPYLNAKYGTDASRCAWTGKILEEEYLPILEAVGDFAKVWCISPEREGIKGFVQKVREELPNCVFSVAHSVASPDEIYDLGEVRLATHHTNATGTRPNHPECRSVCVDEAVNYSDDIYAEIICDSKGIHVDPLMLRLIKKIKGVDKIILVSDNCYFDGPVPKGYDGVTDLCFDNTGDITSNLTLDVACQNMMKHTGAGLCDVFKMASFNPAKLLGWKNLGQIRKGATADLVIVDPMMNVQKVILSVRPS